MSLRDKMLAVMADVNSAVAEREELVELIAIALLTRKNLFTLYERFPLPKLVFGFQISEQGKVSNCRLGVVADEELKCSTEMFCYPFSNVRQIDFHPCTGNNVLPPYKSPSSISNLPGYLLCLPNNDDYFDVRDNRLRMEYRDLLEHLKDKDPSYYYSDVLIPNGKTLKDFIGG